ncbi:MAG: DUF2207 domain-containing protein [Thermomicrobiales bacterium]
MSDETRQLLHLFFILLMLLVLVGGSVAILLLWWMRGRDPHVGPVASYVSEPPDDIPPGVAGTLIDERADYHDVLAALFGLGRHGAVRITYHAGKGRRGADYEIAAVDPTMVQDAFERTVLEAVFGGAPEPGQTVHLSRIHDRFAGFERAIRTALYQELVTNGFFMKSPEETRRRWLWVARAGLVISIIGGGFLGFSLDPFAFLAMAAGIVVSMILMRVSRSMPRKTLKGAEAAAMWGAFRTYLKDIRKYERVDEAKELFDRYLPYAVAFGLEREWVKTFAAVGTPTPTWFDTVTGGGLDLGDVLVTAMQLGQLTGGGGSRTSGGSGGGGNVSLPDIDLPNVGLPDLGSLPDVDVQGLADVVGGGLQGASDAFGGLFDLAGSIFDSIDIDFD